MKTKAEILALLGECLTLPAVLWIFTVTFFARDEKGLIPGAAAVCVIALISLFVFLIVLRKERSIVFIAVVSGIVFALGTAALIVLYKGSVGFGYVLCALMLSGSAVFATLNYCLTKQTLGRHLGLIDVCVLSVIWLFINLSAMYIDAVSVVLIIAVLILDVAGSAALRMSEEGMNEGVGKAFVLASLCACAAAGLIFGLSQVFLRTGNITQTVINAVTGFFRWIWKGIEAFFEWLSQFFTAPEAEEVIIQENPGMTGVPEMAMEEYTVDPAVIAAVFIMIVAAVVIFVIYRLRKTRIRIGKITAGKTTIRKTGRTKGFFKERWKAFLSSLKFRNDAFIYRNTPPGVLVYLEQKERKKKRARGKGESIREFLNRVSPGKEFEKLADDLEGKYYGGEPFSMTKKECRSLRKKYEKEMRGRAVRGVSNH